MQREAFQGQSHLAGLGGGELCVNSGMPRHHARQPSAHAIFPLLVFVERRLKLCLGFHGKLGRILARLAHGAELLADSRVSCRPRRPFYPHERPGVEQRNPPRSATARAIRIGGRGESVLGCD